MQKKIKIEVWVEPATNAGGLSQFIDNIKQFAEDLTKYGVPDMGENAYDLEIVDTEAKICDEQNQYNHPLTNRKLICIFVLHKRNEQLIV